MTMRKLHLKNSYKKQKDKLKIERNLEHKRQKIINITTIKRVSLPHISVYISTLFTSSAFNFHFSDDHETLYLIGIWICSLVNCSLSIFYYAV